MRFLEDIKITLNDDEIIRLLRSKNSMKKSPPKEMIDEVNKMKEIALELIHPRGVFEFFDSKELKPRFLFSKSEKTAFAVCTIGRELEEKVSRKINGGGLAEGVILDAIASHAAEETAEKVNQKILEEIANVFKDKEATCRFSPGYCQWNLEEGQQLIFQLLPTEVVDVTLSVSMMMKPIKSVSFAINIGEEIDKELGIRSCETCNLVNCAYRRL
ncbi:MAG: hypothetical protein H7641_12335 [Candidatus Heimdallarchaeota archaeon]|nr:hypothetical protein [Candidatus Heimdallarchaeota archaeon]MCK4878347.1 hypothetical protein [Candidatus Heimdallarchaeota archaeon]